MKSEIIQFIEDTLNKKYKQTKRIEINDKEYTLYIVPNLCEEDLNLFQGFLFCKTNDKNELNYFKSKYTPLEEGYIPRIGIIIFNDMLLIKDFIGNKKITKNINKINESFTKKIKKVLENPTESNIEKLFDRTDLIEEFWQLFKKSREFLLENIKGIPEEKEREEFVDNFMLQMLTLWYLQERGFFNRDKSYFITKFNELKDKKSKLNKKFKKYYEFLEYLFQKISNDIGEQYYKDNILGKVVVIGPAIFLNGNNNKKAISIPDKCFYKEGLTQTIINIPPKKLSDEIPLLNLFESRDWTEGNIDEFVLGALYEKLITYQERKKTGAYYTPEEITQYICENTIKPYLIDKINERFSSKFEDINKIIESNDKKIINALFEELKEIKIVDPAVGSGHFLESAINVLLEIYEKVWEKAKEKRMNIEILASNEKGEITKINLIEIKDKERFRLLIKFFIILSRNIYGVDINPSALKVARARLFLTLAKHFKVREERDLFVRFPNVHFNLREGNSLIGYIEIKKDSRKQTTLFDFDEEKEEHIVEKIKVVQSLKRYLNEISKTLGIGGITQDIKELNKIVSKKNIKWSDFEKVLKTKEKLIRILIVSLNSQYAVPINNLLNDITKIFNEKLDEQFAKEYNVDLEELKKIKTFHWSFEFPEVFLRKNPGFDIVVGNPPYGNILTDKEKEILHMLNFKVMSTDNTGKGTKNSAAIFIERGKQLLRKNGESGYIVPKALLYIEEWQKTRRLLLKDVNLLRIADCSKAFNEVKLEMCIIIYKNQNAKLNNKVLVHNLYLWNLKKYSTDVYQVDKKFLTEERFITEIDEEKKKIIETIRENSIELGKVCDIWRGLNLNKYVSNEPNKNSIKVLRGDDITRYAILKFGYINKKLIKKLNFSPGRVIFQEIIAHIEKPSPHMKLMGTLNNNFLSINTVTNISVKESNSVIDEKFILMLLNSRFTNWFVYKYIFVNSIRTMHFSGIYAKSTPIFRLTSKNAKVQVPFISLVDYMLFLNATEEKRTKEKENIEFIDKQVIDSLVYELYFKEKFHEDGLYPKIKNYLLEAVAKHLKPIEYDRWAKLYWKKQIEGKLSKKEERELEKLEKENMKTIERVVKKLKEDKEIQKWIKKIKSHKWVKVIEGKEND